MKDEILTFSTGAMAEDPSKWVEGTMSTTGDPWVEMPALLFYTGTHKGKPWGEQDLDRMDSQFQRPKGDLDWTVPLQLDHDESADKTRGHLRDTWRQGKQLFGTVRYVGEQAVRNAKNGLYKKLSLGVYGTSKRIREVSVTPFPHLVGASTYSESEDETPMAENATKTEAPTKDEPTNFTEWKAQIEQTFSERTAKLEQRLEKSEKRNEELEGVVRFTQRAAEIDKFSDAGKTLPAMRETELKLVETFSDEQMVLFRAYKEATPALVDVDVHGSQDPEEIEAFKQGKDLRHWRGRRDSQNPLGQLRPRERKQVSHDQGSQQIPRASELSQVPHHDRRQCWPD